MQCFGITDKPIKLLQSFVYGRHQQVLLNCQFSTWLPVPAGVPQGSILDPLFFLNYINELLNEALELVLNIYFIQSRCIKANPGGKFF